MRVQLAPMHLEWKQNESTIARILKKEVKTLEDAQVTQHDRLNFIEIISPFSWFYKA